MPHIAAWAVLRWYCYKSSTLPLVKCTVCSHCRTKWNMSSELPFPSHKVTSEILVDTCNGHFETVYVLNCSTNHHHHATVVRLLEGKRWREGGREEDGRRRRGKEREMKNTQLHKVGYLLAWCGWPRCTWGSSVEGQRSWGQCDSASEDQTSLPPGGAPAGVME